MNILCVYNIIEDNKKVTTDTCYYAIEDTDEPIKYIREHVQDYIVDIIDRVDIKSNDFIAIVNFIISSNETLNVTHINGEKDVHMLHSE